MYHITLMGRIPSKKNSKQIVGGARKFIVPSNSFKVWHAPAMIEIRQQIRGLKLPITLAYDHLVTLRFFAPDKIKGDLTNKAESIMDLLVDAGVLEDDNWFAVGAIDLRFGGVDRERPRVEVEIRTE